MIYKIVSARDKLVGFGSPMLEVNLEVAKRSFANAMVHQDPGVVGDIDLYHIGDFDSDSGLIVPCNVPVFLAAGAVVKEESV